MSKQKGFDIFSLATDPKLELEGVWKDFIVNGEVVAEFKVARANNSEYTRWMTKLYSKYRQVIDLGASDDATDEQKAKGDEVARLIDRECFCRAILIDFKGFLTPDGKELKSTLKNKALLYINVVDFINQVRRESANIENYRAESIITDVESLGKL